MAWGGSVFRLTTSGFSQSKGGASSPEGDNVERESMAKTKNGQKSVMDEYGATNPAEFFAVATETFFEKPVQLQKKHPELYHELQGFYKVAPIEWVN